MLFAETIARKRDGGVLTGAEIEGFVQEYTRGELPDYQASALLMAIYLRGMDAGETAALTAAMAASGRELDLAALERARPTIDKHSTGGVGDKTSLVVVPILAAAGASVCKMSGRGLGHTGGTLDKLEAIPGFRVDLPADEMVAQVARIGACLCGQTGDLAPADKKLYSLRDTTATVGSLPLIVSSILSKKLAGGARRFLFDVKVGSGALMKTLPDARALAHALVEGGEAAGRDSVAVLSDMSQPLGRAVGNALEVCEAIEMLTPNTSLEQVDSRFRELCLSLAAEGIRLCGLEDDLVAAREEAERQVDSGAALAKLREVVVAQGGDGQYIDQPSLFPAAPVVRNIAATAEGWIAAIDAAALGTAVVRMGGGRAQKSDTIDHCVGLIVRAHVGERVVRGQILLDIHAASDEGAAVCAESAIEAYTFSDAPPEKTPLILERIPSQ